jgi:hypothetical protein
MNQPDQEILSNIWINLTPNGQTMIIIYPCPKQNYLAEAFINKLGAPEYFGITEDHPENICLLFSHQDIPDFLKEYADEIATHALLTSLGFYDK